MFALLGGTTIILGAYYMLKMFQNVMLGKTNTTLFTDLSISEIITFALIIGVLLFFGIYSKPISDLVTPAIQDVLVVINK
jgi:NADH-quinone oxidoreductase subunit M